MKTHLFILLTTGLLYQSVHAQVTTNVVKANFGVEADLSNNFYNNLPQPAVDDWFWRPLAGSGQGIIDTAGAAAIISRYTTQPASRNWPFAKLMKQAPYSTLNNRLLLDAIFHRDFHGSDSTVFASGSNKNGMSPISWSCPAAQSIPDKNDILDAYTHVRRAGPNITDSMWMFGAIAIENTTGSRYFDFELYQTDLFYNRNLRQFQNYGPDAGHTSWRFDAAGNVIASGDIIFTAEFGTAGLSMLQARIWINKASMLMTPTAFNWGGQFDGDGSGATYGYASILPKTAGSFYTGVPTRHDTTWAGAFKLVRDNNTVVNNFLKNQFMEFSVNLTKLGIDPGNYGNACGTPFRRVMIKTRASTSFTAELKDFIAPFRLFDYAQAEITTEKTYYCRVMDTATLSIFNPIPTSIYTWSTTNGNILGPTTGTSIQVNMPGLYQVTQRLHPQCPIYANDTISIFYDTACTLLDLSIRDFTAGKRNQEAQLGWQLQNNELAASIHIEYSQDNRSFQTLGTAAVQENSGLVSYHHNQLIRAWTVPVLYFRIRVHMHSGEVKYSQVQAIRMQQTGMGSVSIFPNPVREYTTLFLENRTAGQATIRISDSRGRNILQKQVRLADGDNQIPIYELSKEANGIYLLSIQQQGVTQTLKLIHVQ